MRAATAAAPQTLGAQRRSVSGLHERGHSGAGGIAGRSTVEQRRERLISLLSFFVISR